jgi:hypothetical protein
MKIRKIGGKFVEKIFGDSKERSLEWPTTEAEFLSMMKKGFYQIDGKQFKLDWEKACGSCWRGESLQHQGAEPQTDEEKAKAKEERKSVKTKGSFISALPPEDQLAMIIKAESAGSDCSAIRAALKLPPK